MPERFFRGLLRFAFRYRVLLLLVAAAVGVASTWLLRGVAFDANVLHLFPQRGKAVRAFHEYLEAFGSLDRLYVVFEAPADRSITEFEPEIERFVERLSALPEIASVDSGLEQPGQDWSYLLDRQLLLYGPDRIDAALSRFAGPELGRALEAARDRLTVPSSDIKAMVQLDPLGLLLDLRAHLTATGLPIGIAAGQRGYISADGGSRLVIAKPTQPPFDTAFARRLNTRVAEISGDLGPPLVVRQAGGYRVAAASEALIKKESVVNSVSSFMGILALVAVVFRSVRPLLVISLPIGLASLVTIATYGAFVPLSAASASSAAILFGLGVDNTLLLYLGYLEGRRAGLSAADAVARLGAAAVSVTIAFTTTAATFFGLLPIDLPALQDLGRIAGWGVLACGVFALLLFPALVPQRLRPGELRAIETPWLPRFVNRRRRIILIAAAVLTVVLGVASFDLKVTPTVQKLDSRAPDGDLEGEIAKRFQLPDDIVFVIAQGEALDPLLDAHARLAAALGSTADVGISSPAVLLPPEASQARTADRLARSGIDPVQFSRRLEDAAVRAGFRPQSFQPFVDRLPKLLDPNQRLTLEGYRANGLDGLLSHHIVRQDGRYLTVTYLYPRSPAALPAIAAAVDRVGFPLRLTGLTIVNAELEKGFLPAFLRGGIIGVAGVIVLLLLGFRNLRLTALSLVPVTLGSLWSAGVLALAGVELDLFSVFGVLMCIGIGVDYGVHVLHRRAQEPVRGMAIALTRTAPSILLAGTTTMIGFGSLIFSSYAPLQALGMVTVVTIIACLATSLLVLPALLGEP
ncbi:MAG TPA: MMPL family transporter [Vicinamibacterales bacterium]|nr:MMPL family transporter [Vicinamibacterales bacterium]